MYKKVVIYQLFNIELIMAIHTGIHIVIVIIIM